MQKIIRSLFILLFIATPVIFCPYNSESFEIPKMYFVYLLTVLIIFFHAVNYCRRQTSLIIYHPLNSSLLIFLSSQIVATAFSIDRHTSFFGYYSRLNGGLLSLISFSTLFFILQNYLDSKFIKTIITVSLTSGTLIAVYGILQHFGVDKNYWPNDDVMARVFSTLGQPNWLAAYLCILIPISINLIKKTTTINPIHYAPSAALLACLYFTKSKSGIIALTISLFIYAILKFNIPKKTVFLVSCLLLLVTGSYLYKTINSSLITDNLNVTSSGEIRKLTWAGAIDIAKKYPLFGTGPETFAFTYYWVRPPSHNLTSEWEFLYNKVHNEYLNYLANTGLVGLITYLFFIVSCLHFMHQHKRFELLSAFISILITSFAGFNVVTTSLFLFLLPLLSAPITTAPQKSRLRVPIIIVATIFCLLSLQRITNYYFADISLASASRADDQNIYPLAYQEIIKAYQLNSDEPTILSKASIISSKIRQTNNSLAFSSLALNISPYDINLWKERTQMLIYLTYTDTKYYTDAIKALNSTSILAPTDAKTFYLLAKFYDAIGDKINTEKNFLKAIDLKSNYDYAYFDLAKFYFDNQQYDLAQKYFQLNLKYAPTNPDAPNYLARIATASAKIK